MGRSEINFNSCKENFVFICMRVGISSRHLMLMAILGCASCTNRHYVTYVCTIMLSLVYLLSSLYLSVSILEARMFISKAVFVLPGELIVPLAISFLFVFPP